MSTEVTPESLRTHAAWLNDRGAKESHMALTRWADDLEREQRPLPTEPGWYPGIVVERGGESCTGALLTDEGEWITSELVLGCHHHEVDSRSTTIRWAEQDGKTPGQTLWEARFESLVWSTLTPLMKDRQEYVAAAVLAAHGNPTLTPVGEHPKRGTRGLLPVMASGVDSWQHYVGGVAYHVVDARDKMDRAVLADPRPDGAA